MYNILNTYTIYLIVCGCYFINASISISRDVSSSADVVEDEVRGYYDELIGARYDNAYQFMSDRLKANASLESYLSAIKQYGQDLWVAKGEWGVHGYKILNIQHDERSERAQVEVSIRHGKPDTVLTNAGTEVWVRDNGIWRVDEPTTALTFNNVFRYPPKQPAPIHQRALDVEARRMSQSSAANTSPHDIEWRDVDASGVLSVTWRIVAISEIYTPGTPIEVQLDVWNQGEDELYLTFSHEDKGARFAARQYAEYRRLPVDPGRRYYVTLGAGEIFSIPYFPNQRLKLHAMSEYDLLAVVHVGAGLRRDSMSSYELRDSVHIRLGEVDETAVRKTIHRDRDQMLHDLGWERDYAAARIVAYDSPLVVHALSDGIQHGDREIARMCAKALLRFTDKEAVKAMKRSIRNTHIDHDARMYLFRFAVARPDYGLTNEDVEELCGNLLSLEEPDYIVMEALRVMDRLGIDGLDEKVHALTDHKSKAVVNAAQNFLRRQ